jgi:hypothetical protein
MGAGTRTLAAISSEIDWFGLHICYVEAGRVVMGEMGIVR